MNSRGPQRHNTIYVNSSALGPPCCQSLGISLVSEVRSHGQTKMVLIECREQLAHAQATTAALETRNNHLVAENLRLTLALGHIAPWAHVQVSGTAEGTSHNQEVFRSVGEDNTGTSKAHEGKEESQVESEYESES